ncbi:MAG: hypothetical protein KC766_35080 [Myxococcales bacterium]|nr:hypothetical protein [Myxococcales bacterium]
MSDDEERLQARLGRRAIVMEVDGFRPPDDPMSSRFGHVGFGLPGETWPESGGKAMLPLCQINLTELPFRPPRLGDVDFITVFIDQHDLPFDSPNVE